MTGLPALVADLARQTMRDPRGGVRRLLAMDLPMEARWIALLLVTVLAVLVTRLSLVFLPKVAVGYVWRTASAMSYQRSRTKGQTSLSGCLATPWCRYIIVATSSLVAKSQTSASSNGAPSMSSKRARGYSSNACRKA